MAIIKSVPQYTFISTGDKVAMYTLRMMCLDTVQMFGQSFTELNSYYIKNLSNDKAKADAKAIELSELLNLSFRGNAEFELNEIRRKRDSQAKEEREAAERAYKERLERWEAEDRAHVQAGVFIIGKYEGMTAEQVSKIDPGYLFWLQAEAEDASGRLGICCKIAVAFLAESGLQPAGYVGTEGKSITVELTLKGMKWTNGQYPTLMFTCATEDHCEVLFFSVAEKFKALEIGEKFTITGLVKEQREGWNNKKQTIINRPKLAK